MDAPMEIAEMLVKLSSPKRPAPESNPAAHVAHPPQENRQKRVCSPGQVRKLNKAPSQGEKTSRLHRSTTTIVQFVDPKNPKLVPSYNRFDKDEVVPLGFESRFFQNRVNWKLQIVENPVNPLACFEISTVDEQKPITSGPQLSAWTAYIRALEAYHETYPQEYLGKINPNYKNRMSVDGLAMKNPIVGVNARNIVGLYNPDVQEKIKNIFA